MPISARFVKAVLLPVAICAIGIAAYSNSFNTPFIFDDIRGISENPKIAGMASTVGVADQASTLTQRPVLLWSFQANYVLTGLSPPAIHATNLAIHLGAALLLFGIVRRTLVLQPMWAADAEVLAAAVAAIWVSHPLNTEAVTYMVQRAESLAGLFYLGVFYCLLRFAGSSARTSWPWALAAIASCALGMGTKEIVLTAPIMAILFDRAFLAGSFREAIRRRWPLYFGLAATWLFLPIATAHDIADFYGQNLSRLDYFRTETGLVAHYLRLTVWPWELCLDYQGWPIARNWSSVTWGYGVLVLAAAMIWALWKRPQLGFLAFWCLGILAPTSTFIPIEAEIGSEHRMYLPLIAVVIAIVLAIWWIGGNSKSAAKKAAFAAITAVLAVMTFQRNIQYRSERGLWQQVVNQYPNDPRAHMNLGADALDNKNWQLAAKEYLVAARINPRTTDGRSCVQNAISALWELNEDAEIEHVYTQQIATDPSFAARWYLYRGEARKTSGLTPASQEDFQAARQAAKEKLQREPQDEESYVVIGVASEELGDIAEARDALTKANQLKIDLFARNELAKLTEKRNAQ